MSKEKLHKNFQDFTQQIDKLAEEEIEAIREKIDAIKAEASKVGESLASSSQNSKAGKEKG